VLVAVDGEVPPDGLEPDDDEDDPAVAESVVVGEVVVVVVVVVLLEVVVVLDWSMPVPFSVMANAWPSTSIVVELDHGPGAEGVNVYVNWHD
jgi:hypothetical protein